MEIPLLQFLEIPKYFGAYEIEESLISYFTSNSFDSSPLQIVKGSMLLLINFNVIFYEREVSLTDGQPDKLERVESTNIGA